MKILYKFASRSRPEKFFACLENITHRATHDNYQILASLDLDDDTMNNEMVIERMKTYEKLVYIFGHSKNKIDAINRDMNLITDWTILINMSDDMVFTCPGFDSTIIDEYQKYLPDGDVLLHFPDQNQGANCMTMSIMDKKYYDRFGYIYHPSYVSLWCDLEAMEVGKLLMRYHYARHQILNHNHPSFFQCPMDAQYALTESVELRSKDYDTYVKRKKNNYYI